jgi:hypothetical protein
MLLLLSRRVERMKEQLACPSALAAPCPSCHEPGGKARSVEVHASQRTVSYVCDRCEHLWEITIDAPLGLLFAEPPP